MTTTNGGPTPPPQQQAPSLNVLGQYIKDFSFENPNAPRSLAPSENQPAINIADAQLKCGMRPLLLLFIQFPSAEERRECLMQFR